MLLSCDTETTGLDIENCEILQFSMVVIDESTWKILSEILLYIRPERLQYIHPKALEVNRLKVEDFDKPPFISKKEAVDLILKWVAQFPKTVNVYKLPILGCNIQYDLDMLQGLFRDTAMKNPFGYRKIDISNNSYLISQVESGLVDASCGGLDAAAKKFEIVFDHHDARADVYATLEIYRNQVEYLRNGCRR